MRLYSLIGALIISVSLPLAGYAGFFHNNSCDQLPGIWKGKAADVWGNHSCTANIQIQFTPVGNHRFETKFTPSNTQPKDCWKAEKGAMVLVCNNTTGRLSDPTDPEPRAFLQVKGTHIHGQTSGTDDEGIRYSTTINLNKQS